MGADGKGMGCGDRESFSAGVRREVEVRDAGMVKNVGVGVCEDEDGGEVRDNFAESSKGGEEGR